MAAQYSFVMNGLTKNYPGAQKPTLNNLSLHFYPAAKVGLILALLAALVAVVLHFTRPVAMVQAVTRGLAVNAVPGSVT